MEDLIIQFLHDLNISQLLATGAMFVCFYKILDKKFEKIDQRFEKIDQRFERMEERFNEKFSHLEEKIEDIDRRLCRIEGSLSTHGHCLFQQKSNQKAE